MRPQLLPPPKPHSLAVAAGAVAVKQRLRLGRRTWLLGVGVLLQVAAIALAGPIVVPLTYTPRQLVHDKRLEDRERLQED